jgi:hypothetical protein
MLCLKRMIDGWREFLGLTRLDGYPRVIVFRYLCEWLDICIKRSVAHSILLLRLIACIHLRGIKHPAPTEIRNQIRFHQDKMQLKDKVPAE